MADAPVVSNTTPIIKLAGVGLLDTLAKIYGDVWIPQGVRDEYEVKAAPSDPDLSALPWLSIHAVTPDQRVAARPGLGKGEIEAISLALVTGARAILLDDRFARKTAVTLGLPVVGTLAVLVRAKRAGHIPAVGPVIDRMIAQGRYVGEALRAQVLREAGENP